MCRLLAYAGPPRAMADLVTEPCHSLVHQSQGALEAKFPVNGDGFGLAWYGHAAAPGVYRDTNPAWSDENLASLCRVVQSGLFIAHVRAATDGATARENCHPFAHDHVCFAHNGQIGNYPQVRRSLENNLPDDLFHHRKGSTDSELLFLLLMHHGLTTNAQRAVDRVTALLAATAPAHGKPTRMTCVWADGQSLFGFRYGSDGKAPTLYQGRTASGGHVLASEPLCDHFKNWTAMPVGQVVRLNRTPQAAL